MLIPMLMYLFPILFDACRFSVIKMLSHSISQIRWSFYNTLSQLHKPFFIDLIGIIN